MKQTISSHDFIDAFRQHDRMDNFSYEGLHALFNWFEEYEDCTGQEIELDVIALCCEFTEYTDLEEFHGVYDKSDFPDMDAINDSTMVISIPDSDSFIIQDF